MNMPTNFLPELPEPSANALDEVLLIASGDSRLAANRICWPAQAELEKQLGAAFAAEGIRVRRGHPYDPELGHGFIYSQRMGLDTFIKLHPEARIVVAEAVWQYSHHVLPGLRSHRGPILTVANWSGQWPGLVGLLNLNASLRKAGVPFSTIWSKDFTDYFLRQGLRQWLAENRIQHDRSHVREFDVSEISPEEAVLGRRLAQYMQRRKAVMGVFDEGCMGMYNAIIDDELLNPIGIFKERLSQSALVAAMRKVSTSEAQKVRDWLDRRGVHFAFGPDPETDLSPEQILEQCKMYIAAVRMAHQFSCDAIGIQYQLGLTDMVPASDLAEGLLNNAERPPVFDTSTGQELYAGRPVPHFNEVDECAGVDAVITNWIWTAMDLDPATTLHDVRWGEHYHDPKLDAFVWVFQISGAAPASHFKGGYSGATSDRQPAMYFRMGGGSLKGVCKPGEIVWSRVFVEGGALHVDLGLGTVVELPDAETSRRWHETTFQWPIMHAVLHGVTRDQFMARHSSNHLNVAYAPSPELAQKAMLSKAVMFAELGLRVHLCGV
jgi:hypothetical protein